jgi:hypothetical protein
LTSPVCWVQTAFDKAVEAGIFPFCNILDQPMLDWIPVDIVKMSAMIRIVADKMIPKPPLPKPPLASFDAAFG